MAFKTVVAHAALFGGSLLVAFGILEFSLRMKIGRASCRKECRSRWSPYH